MNIHDAAHKTVQDYPGGSMALATRMVRFDEHGQETCMSGNVLRNKANPNNTTHHLTLAEASEIMGLTGDHRILHALASEHGYTLDKMDDAEVGCVITTFLSAAALKGQLSALINKALEDGRVSVNESKDVGELCADLQAVFAELARVFRAKAKQGAPA